MADDRRPDGNGEQHATESGDGGRPLSRRRFVQASTVASAGLLGLGAGAPATAQQVTEEYCESGATFTVGDGDFELINNKWGNETPTQCIREFDDGSYGWRFDGGGTGINYPEVYLGRRPWGSDTDVDEFPVRRGDVEEFTMEWDVDIEVTQGNNWDLAEEWWLMNGPPNSDGSTITHEIMLVLDWGSGHSHYMQEENVWTDQFGNQIDYWADYSDSGGGTGDDFHIFRISGGASSGQVDLTEIIDFMSERHGVSKDLLISGVELGTEYFDGGTGEVTLSEFDVTINGSTYESGPGGDDGDTTPTPTAPDAPNSAWTNWTDQTTVDVGWNAVADADEYDVYVDGAYETTTAGTTATLSGLSPGTSYQVGVEAVNGAGSSSRTTVSATTNEGQTGTEQVQLRVELESNSASPGSAVDAQIVADEVPNGLSGYQARVAIDDTSVATVEGASYPSYWFNQGVEVAADGSSVSLQAVDGSGGAEPGDTDVELASVSLSPQGDGQTTVSASVSQMDSDDDGSDVPTATTADTLTVSGVSEIDGAMPQDIDGDGKYEDLNGNGRLDSDDVVIYFNNYDESVIMDHVDAYDYNESGHIDFDDIVRLFNQL